VPDAIVVEDLTKRFGSFVAVDRVSFAVPRGEVVGFLGPNGAGKTTTLGMLAGLVPPDGGRARIDGSVGALVEEPAFYSALSGRANLDALATLAGADRAGARELLARVGLDEAAGAKRYRGYSQGMRRRLGLAAALLGDPDVLLLDEPTNGLDPAGQLEVRGMLHDLAARGKTVLVSSHLLHEVQETCSRAIVLSRGKVIAQGTMAELLRGTGRVVVEVDDVARALATLPDAERLDDARVSVRADDPAAVNRALVLAGVGVRGLAREGAALEARFLEMTEAR